MLKKIIIIGLITLGLIVLLSMYMLYKKGRLGCISGDKECIYNRRLFDYNLATAHDYDENYAESLRTRYLFMSGYFFDKLDNQKNYEEYSFILQYNKILNFYKTKLYIENCLDNEEDIEKLNYCISRYSSFNKDKEEVLKRIDKFKNSDNQELKSTYQRVINRYKWFEKYGTSGGN